MNNQTNNQSNNPLDDQFLTTLRERYPAEQKMQLKARLDQIAPKKRWWRSTKQTAQTTQLIPRLAGVFSLVVLAAVSYIFLTQTNNSPDIVDNPLENEAVAQQDKTKLDDVGNVPETINVLDIVYRWEAGEPPVVPAEIPEYIYAVDMPQSDAEMQTMAEQMGITNLTHYYHARPYADSDLHEFKGDDDLAVAFLSYGTDMVIYRNDSLLDGSLITRPLNHSRVPLPSDLEIERTKEFINAHPVLGAADSYHIDPDGVLNTDYGQQAATFTPQLEVPGIDDPVPVHDLMFRPLSHLTFNEDGEVIDMQWIPVTIKPSGDMITIMPALDALAKTNRHSSKNWWPSAGLYHYVSNDETTLSQATEGKRVTVQGDLQLVTEAETGQARPVVYARPAFNLHGYPLQIPDRLQAEMNDPSAIGNVSVTGIVRFNETQDRYVIDVTAWEKKQIQMPKCHIGVINNTSSGATFTSDEDNTYRLQLPATFREGQSVQICTDKQGPSTTLEWDSIMTLPNDDHLDGKERIITSARLVYKLPDAMDNSPLNKLEAYWEFTGETTEDVPFVLRIRAD